MLYTNGHQQVPMGYKHSLPATPARVQSQAHVIDRARPENHIVIRRCEKLHG